MKNLTKIFMAVVAGMFAFSCATDTTEDLGIQLGNGENGANGATVELSLSLEESRTQLGEKAGQKYPLYWSEGDEISVNGVAYTAQISETNRAVATFMVAEADKYEVVYPATNAGVLFAEKQNHVVEGNTFESGVSTMYGTGTAGEPITLHHLTGVLKFAVTGEAVLSKIQISTIDRAPIAGAFDIDFETGKLTATEASKKVIEYSFGEEGLQLTAEAQWMHVAVPAGKYDELYVTLYEQGNAGNIMYATVKAGDEKPLTAGRVREFNTPITYSPNAQLFVISSAEQLAAFKAAIESEAGLQMDAVFTEDIDMTGVEWSAIAGTKYTGTIHGNGYAIKGLTAPLFHSTSASIKGLHLVDVNLETNITATADRMYGALVGAHTSVAIETPATIENCSVSGTMVINNPSYPVNQTLYIGGIVGASYGGVIDSCVSNVTITAGKLGSDYVKHMGVAGVVALTTTKVVSETTLYAHVYNSKNEGNITIELGSDNTNRVNSNLYLGGVVGYSQESYNLGAQMSNCENSGAITFGGTATTANIGGLIGSCYGDKTASFENVKNTGVITVKNGSTITNLYLGGVAGISKSCPMDTAVNAGNIVVESGVKPTKSYVGGVIGLGTKDGDAFTVKNLTNNGSITFGGESADATTAIAGSIAGVIAYSQATIVGATNNGSITVSGDLNLDIATPATFHEAKGFNVAGVVGYKTMAYTNNLTNTGTITVSSNMNSLIADVTDEKGNTVKQYAQVNIGGLVGYTSNNLNILDENNYTSVSSGDIIVSGNTTNCTLCIGGSIAHSYQAAGQDNETCSSDIQISGTHTGNLYVGGVISANMYSCNNMTFNGSIMVAQGTVVDGECCVAGVVPYVMTTAAKAADVPALTDLTNTGAITVGATTSNAIPYVAGCVGVADDTDGQGTGVLSPILTNIVNTGAVTYNGVHSNADLNCFVAGCAGRSRGALTTARNSGTITFAGDVEGGKAAFVGGIAGTVNDVAEGAENNGEVKTVNGAKFTKLNISGVFADISGLGSAQKYTSCFNTATISHTAENVDGTGLGVVYMTGVGGTNANAHCTSSYNTGNLICTGRATTIVMSGIASDAGRTMTDCYNTGNITMNGTADIAYLCGLAYESDSAITRCYNTGNLTMSGTLTGSGILTGLFSKLTGSMTDCYNGEKGTTKGAITFSAGKTIGGALYIGGSVYTTTKNNTNVVNYAPITVAGNTGKSLYLSGLAVQVNSGIWTECVNYGNITISGVIGDENVEGSDAGSDAFVGGVCERTNTLSTEGAVIGFVRCQNHGNITFTETSKVASGIRAGCLGARFEYVAPVVVEDCWNSGDFTFNGKSSVRTGGTFYLSPGIASISKGTFTMKGSLINSGDLSVNADASATGDLPMAGVIAVNTVGIALVEGETEALIANTGNITINTKNTTGQRAFFGGILGYLKTGAIDERIKFINTGNVTVTGEMNNCYVGGIGGACLKPIGYAECYCTISTPGTGYKGVGMLSGPKYQANTYDIKDGAVGGTIYSVTVEDPNSGEATIGPGALTAENFTDYIYGFVDGAPTGTAVADRYEFLTEAPTVTLPAKLPAAK